MVILFAPRALDTRDRPVCWDAFCMAVVTVPLLCDIGIKSIHPTSWPILEQSHLQQNLQSQLGIWPVANPEW